MPTDPKYPDREILHGTNAEAKRVLKACFDDDALAKLRDQLQARADLVQQRINELWCASLK